MLEITLPKFLKCLIACPGSLSSNSEDQNLKVGSPPSINYRWLFFSVTFWLFGFMIWVRYSKVLIFNRATLSHLQTPPFQSIYMLKRFRNDFPETRRSLPDQQVIFTGSVICIFCSHFNEQYSPGFQVFHFQLVRELQPNIISVLYGRVLAKPPAPS